MLSVQKRRKDRRIDAGATRVFTAPGAEARSSGEYAANTTGAAGTANTAGTATATNVIHDRNVQRYERLEQLVVKFTD